MNNGLYKNLLLKLSKNEYDNMKMKQNKNSLSNIEQEKREYNRENEHFMNYIIIKKIDEILLDKIFRFIKNNSYKNVKKEYSKEIIQYLIKYHTCILFYENNENNNENDKNTDIDIKNILGIVFFKITDKLSIKENNINTKCLYINWMFLCNKLYGKKSVTMILEIIKQNCIYEDIKYIIYKTDRNINKKLFYKKYSYYRPINVNKLLEQDMIQNDNDENVLKKVYNTFSYPIEFLKNYNVEMVSSSCNYNVKDLSCFINDELYREYEIFEKFDEKELCELLDNDIFYKFVIKDIETDEIECFMCLYKVLDTYFDQEKLINGIVCCIFVKNTIKNKSYVLEMISEYCYKNSIFDMVTIPHFLEVKVHEYKNFKLMRLKIHNLYYIEKINGTDINGTDINGTDINGTDINGTDINGTDIKDKIYKNCFLKF